MIESVSIRNYFMQMSPSYAELIPKRYSISVHMLIGQHFKPIHLLVKDISLMA